MEEVYIGIHCAEHEYKRPESRQCVCMPSRLRYPSRLLATASKYYGEDETPGYRTSQQGISPTDAGTRL